MKTILANAALTLSLCALAMGQGTTGDRVVVPHRNTSHPRIVNCRLMQGSITVKTHTGDDVIVEDTSSSSRRTGNTPAGMRRLDMPTRGLEVVEEDNVIDVRNRVTLHGSLLITVVATWKNATRSPVKCVW